VRNGGDILGLHFGYFDVRNEITDDLHRLAASIAGTINRLGGVDDPVVKAILDATEDPNVIAEKLSAALSRKNHYHMSVIGGYKGELDMERPPNDEEVAAASIAGTINRLGGVDDPVVKAILDATEDPNMIAEKLSAALSRMQSRRAHINVLGAGGGVLVEKALALDNKSLDDVSDGDLDVVIKNLQSEAPGRKAYKTMSADEESQLNEKVRLHYEQSLKDYDECLEQRFIERSGEWRFPKPGKFSEEEIKIIMDAKSVWNTKNMNKKLASMLEGRSTTQVAQWICSYKKKCLRLA
jgi:hypothetical protein